MVFAPKPAQGHSPAQGFNPGNHPNKWFALKGREMRTSLTCVVATFGSGAPSGRYLFSVLSQSSSSSSFVLDHTVPYGTALLGGVFPGTSCQATIAPSLRDNWQQALARYCGEMSASASRRDD